MRPGPDLVSIQIPAPAAGADFSYLIPAALGGNLQVRFLSFRLTTSAAAANRSVAASIEDPSANTRGRAESSVVQVASGQVRYTFGMTGTAYAGASGENVAIPFQFAFCAGGDLITSRVESIQAADQLDRIFLWLERFEAVPAPRPRA